jgi:hypothetical protein
MLVLVVIPGHTGVCVFTDASKHTLMLSLAMQVPYSACAAAAVAATVATFLQVL